MAENSNTELHRVLGRMEGKLDGVLASVAGLHKDHEKLESRVHSLESRVYGYAGGVAILAAIAVAFLRPIVEKLWT